MPLNSNDLFVVQRQGKLFKVPSSTLKDDYGSTAQVHIGENPPPGTPVQGDLWWSTLEGNLFIWYDETAVGGDSAQWVDASPAFVEIDYERIEDYLDQSVLDNAVSQIKSEGIVEVNPPNGKGVVTIGVDTTNIDTNIENLDSRLDQEIQDRTDGDSALQDNIDLKVDITDFETDQQRQDDEIKRLENIIKDLADRLDQLEDQVNNVTTIDGGYPNAEGVFDEPDTNGGENNAAGVFDEPETNGGANNAAGYD
jgi:hypothetical protein